MRINQDLQSADSATNRVPLIERQEQKFGPSELWYAIVERWRFIAILTIIAVLLASFAAMRLKKYTASGSIRLQPDAAAAYKISAQSLGDDSEDKKTNTEVRIIGSRTILLKVASDLDLANSADFWGTAPKKRQSLSDPETRDKVYERMQSIVKIVHEPRTEVVDISTTTTSQLLSTKISNDIINQYIAHMFEVRYGSVDRVSKWMVTQLNDLREAVERDQTELVDLQARLGVLGLDPRSSSYLQAEAMEGITKASSETTIARILAEAKLRYLESGDPNLIENEQNLLQSPQQQQNVGLLQSLRAQEAEAAASYADLSARFGSNYPSVKQAKARLDAITQRIQLEQRRILNQARTAYQAAAAAESLTRQAMDRRKDEAFKSRNEMVRYIILQRTYEADRNLYEGLTLKLHEAGINAGLESGQVDVVDLAELPTFARKPLPYQWFLIVFVGMELAGVLIVIALARLDPRLKSGEDAEAKLGLPLLTVLPQADEEKLKGVDFLREQHSGFVEGVQVLRSGVLLSSPNAMPKLVMVTSCLPGEGKSTVSRSLATMLAIHGKKILLIDGDMHKPVQHKILKTRGSKGFSGILSSLDPLSSAVQPVPGVDGLFLLPAGPKPPQPAVLLSSDRLTAVLKEAEEQFDIVIVDLAPILSVSDPLLLARLADGVILVVRQNRSPLHSIRTAIEMLQRAHGTIVGFVMNGVDTRLKGRGEFYGKYGAYGAGEEEA